MKKVFVVFLMSIVWTFLAVHKFVEPSDQFWVFLVITLISATITFFFLYEMQRAYEAKVKGLEATKETQEETIAQLEKAAEEKIRVLLRKSSMVENLEEEYERMKLEQIDTREEVRNLRFTLRFLLEYLIPKN